MRHQGVLYLLGLLAAGCSESAAPTDNPDRIAPAGSRSTVDRPAEVTGPQIHVVYLVPRDGLDRGLDTIGMVEESVTRFQRWLADRTARTLRADLWQGRLDITFFRSRRTDQQIASFGRFVLNALYAELRTAGFDRPGTKYLIYYDGTNPLTCGNALQEGPAAAVYLQGSYERNSCVTSFATNPDAEEYWDFAMLHEVMHTLGAVHFNAPDHDDARRWHVTDRTDLMYGGGDFTWRPEHIDREGTAYFGDKVPPWGRNLELDPIFLPPGSGFSTRPLMVQDTASHFPPLGHDVLEPRAR